MLFSVQVIAAFAAAALLLCASGQARSELWDPAQHGGLVLEAPAPSPLAAPGPRHARGPSASASAEGILSDIAISVGDALSSRTSKTTPLQQWFAGGPSTGPDTDGGVGTAMENLGVEMATPVRNLAPLLPQIFVFVSGDIGDPCIFFLPLSPLQFSNLCYFPPSDQKSIPHAPYIFSTNLLHTCI